MPEEDVALEALARAQQGQQAASDEPRTLRCPLCCQQFVVRSEAECTAHIEQCRGFHAEYGAGSRRSGLVSGMEALSASPEEEAKLIEALPAESRAKLEAGTAGKLVDLEEVEQWDEYLQQTKDIGMPLIADFGGKFCKPCKAIRPFVEELAAEYTKCK